MIRYIIFVCAVAVGASCAAQTPSSAHLNLDDGLALEGYDPVAYITENKAIEGAKQFSTQYRGATYRFRSAENQRAFQNNPEAFLPQYGGWCAYAMGASGEKVDVDPETFKVRNGKLYLFYNRFFNNTLVKWNENEKVLESQADRSWNKIINSSSH